MKYFQMLPKLAITNSQTTRLVTNLLARVNVISSLVDNPLLFYTYDIQEGDTPEIIAHKYYGDIEKFWIVLISNQIFDPQWDWPMSSSVFNNYMTQKYGANINALNHYEKIVTKTTNGNSVIEKFVIDEDTYNSLQESSNDYTLNGEQINVSITGNIVDNFEYEFELNESKRNIKILNKNYADKMEIELMKLMNT